MCYSALVKRDLDYLHKNYGAIVIRQDLDEFTSTSQSDPKHFPPLHSRIYPGHYAPVIVPDQVHNRVQLQRYGAYPHPNITNPGRYTTYNARRDNLTSKFWSDAFMQHHGFIVLNGFFEWVEVKDLLKAGVVTLPQVEAEFTRQTEERKAKILIAGKPYRPTATELKPTHLRKIIIQFKPEDGSDLIVPVIFSPSGQLSAFANGFAIITDEPPGEIRSAGHDRCPIILRQDALSIWLHPEHRTVKEMDAVLMQRNRVTFKHQLPAAA